MNRLPVMVRLRNDVPGLPYRNPANKQVEGVYTYWVQIEFENTRWTLFLDVDYDINRTESKEFLATAYFMRDDLGLEDRILRVLRGQEVSLLNGPHALGEMALQEE